MRKIFYSLLVLSFCFSAAQAEFFYLKSGKVVSGKIISETDDSITINVSGSGSKRKIMIYDIDEITKTPKVVPEGSEKTEKASDAEQAKTQFTSDLKQEKNDGDTYVKDNKSGVLVFNVKETVIEKPKASDEKQAKQQSKPAEDEEFDAALFLLGPDSVNSIAPAPPPPTESPAANDYDAALFLLDSEAAESVANDPLAKKENKSDQTQNDEYYNSDLFLLDEQSANDENIAESSHGKLKAEASTYQNPDNETFLAISFDLKGENVFSGTVKEGGVKGKGDLTEDADYGISLSAEQYGYLSRYAALGLGIGFQFKRSLEETTGKFGFLPLYAAFKMRIISEEDYHVYAVGHLGYNFLLANFSYLDQCDANGGLYYAGGLGVSYNSYVFQVLYSVSNGSIKYSNSLAGDKIDRDVEYSKIGLYVGYLL